MPPPKKRPEPGGAFFIVDTPLRRITETPAPHA